MVFQYQLDASDLALDEHSCGYEDYDEVENDELHECEAAVQIEEAESDHYTALPQDILMNDPSSAVPWMTGSVRRHSAAVLNGQYEGPVEIFDVNNTNYAVQDMDGGFALSDNIANHHIQEVS